MNGKGGVKGVWRAHRGKIHARLSIANPPATLFSRWRLSPSDSEASRASLALSSSHHCRLSRSSYSHNRYFIILNPVMGSEIVLRPQVEMALWSLSCLPSTSQAVPLVLSCLPSASQTVQLVFSCLPGYPSSPFLLP